MKIKSIVALQLDDNRLKILHFKKEGPSSSILAAGTVELSHADEAAAGQELREFLNGLKVSTPWAIACFSRGHATTRLLSLPSTEAAEIRNMVGFQAVKQVPFGKDEIVLDYTVLGKNAEGYSQILLTIVHKKVVQKALALLQNAGLTVLSLRLNSQEAAAFYEEYGKEKGVSPARTLFVDFDSSSTDFAVMENRSLSFSRSVNVGKEAAASDRFFSEVQNTLALYNKEEPNNPLKGIVLVNPPAAAQNLFSERQKELGLPVRSWAVQEKMLGSVKKNALYRIPAHNVSFSSLFGVGKNLEIPSLNFFPEKLDQARQAALFQKALFRLAWMLLGALLLASGFLLLKARQQDAILSSIQQQIQSVRGTVRALEKKKEKIQLIEAQRDRNNFCLDLLAEVYRAIPIEVSLDSFYYDSQAGVTLKGTAFTLSDVFNLIPKMEQSPYFEKVSSKGTTTKKIKEKIFTDFQLELPLEKGKPK